MRAASIHVMGDVAGFVMVTIGPVLARTFGWLWMNPLFGIVGAVVVASWSYGLVWHTGALYWTKSLTRL